MKILGMTLVLLVIIIGILISAIYSFNPLWWLLIFGAFLSGFLILSIFNRPKLGWLIFICVFCFSGFWFNNIRQDYNHILQRNLPFHQRVITITGVQIQRVETTLYGTQFLLQVKAEKEKDRAKGGGPSGKILVSYYRGKLLHDGYGCRIRISGKFKGYPAGKPGLPEFAERRGICGSLFAVGQPVLVKGPGLPFPLILANQLREAMFRSGRKVLKPINARLLHGMIFNDRLSNEITDRKLVSQLRRTGTIHLVSVSGLHVGFLVIALNWFLGWIRVPKRWRILPLIGAVWFYIMMTGMNPPVLRAGIMMIIYSAAELLNGGDHPLNRLSLAALILLFWNPYYLFEVSFQLSFIATLGVVWLYPKLKEYFPIKHVLIKPIWDAVLVSLGAQIMVTPLIIYYFQQIAWISPLANLLFFIPAEFIIIGGLIGETIALALPWIGHWILLLVDYNLTVIRWIAYILASQNWAASWSPIWPWPWMFGYYLAILISLELLRPNLLTKKRVSDAGLLLAVLLIVLNIVIWTGALQHQQGPYLQFTVIDVGQGDALLIQTPDGINLLMDGGDEGKGISKVIPFLHSVGVERLDLVIASHGHQDHLSGLAEVLEEIPTRKLYLPQKIDSLEVKEFLERIAPIHITYEKPTSGMKFQLGAYGRGTILDDPEAIEENDRSLVVMIQYGKNKLLLTGDLSEQGEAILARRYPQILRASVLKVGHHGSSYASGLSFITQVRPKVAIISVGANNHFGHPGVSTLNRLQSLGIDVYRTDRQGSIIVKLYGNRFSVIRSK
jgi:competence protein ComEC